MEPKKNLLKIAVLDDSDFYNRIITKQLESYTQGLSIEKNFDFNIESYAHADDFIRNLKDDIDIAFVDYYLGSGVTGFDVLQIINKKCKHCKVVIISQARNELTTIKTLSNGASAFILKDKNALAKTCFFVEHEINKKFS